MRKDQRKERESLMLKLKQVGLAGEEDKVEGQQQINPKKKLTGSRP